MFCRPAPCGGHALTQGCDNDFVEETYDYTSTEIETAKWYTHVIETRKAGWSAPYYAEAAEAMVVDYGAPVLDSRGEPIGIVDACEW
mgnify:CR=1 FL=1